VYDEIGGHATQNDILEDISMMPDACADAVRGTLVPAIKSFGFSFDRASNRLRFPDGVTEPRADARLSIGAGHVPAGLSGTVRFGLVRDFQTDPLSRHGNACIRRAPMVGDAAVSG
jgi:hypothetical protein